MRLTTALLLVASLWPFATVACPAGMEVSAGGCNHPYVYSGWDMMRDRRAAIDAMGANHRNSGPPLTAEEASQLTEKMRRREKEKEEQRKAVARGTWAVDSKSTPEGNLCAAVFSKYELGEGGMVTVMGFQSPKPDAWLIFQGVGLPKPRDVSKMKITLQQDDEPAQTLQVFSHRETREVGTILFAVPGLGALLNGMSDTQRFRLSDSGKVLLDIQWHSAAPVIEELRQCAQASR